MSSRTSSSSADPLGALQHRSEKTIALISSWDALHRADKVRFHASDNILVFIAFERAGGVHQKAAGRERSRALRSIAVCRSCNSATSLYRSFHSISGLRASVPVPDRGVHQNAIEPGREGQRLRRIQNRDGNVQRQQRLRAA